jgi:hypothetical protein
MTKKHFEAIAHTLNANHAPMELVLDMADTLSEHNARFDRDVFIKASTHNIVDRAEYLLRRVDHPHFS